ncbi:MAG: SDR family oxidoreductase [Chitinophagaceae bacterium]|nr:SDR family oxidoreductase [Chitinophagaceae bacterium]MBK8951993.1 SDR family oxidoreductase [Chitinophagaceae bacterium]
MNIVITGASRGIGKAIAEMFAQNGHNLFLCSKSELPLYNTLQELLTKYPNVSITARPSDLSDGNQAAAFANWVLETATPDVLVNNAGGFEPGSINNEPDGILEKMLAINLFTAYNITRALIPKMIAAKKGHVFTICSIASLNAYPNGGAYSVSKYALHGFSANLREEMKPHNIKVTAVFPGAVLTDSWGDFDNSANRIMVANDVARMIFSASQLSPAACVEDIVLRPQLGDL